MDQVRCGWRAPALSGAFVGRDRELATVVRALDGPAAVVLIEGEAGIGKTRLVRESLAAVMLERHRIIEVACPPLHEPFPLGPLVDALQLHQLDGVELSPLAGALRPLFPEWAQQLPPAPEPLDDPAATRHRLFRALAELIERLGVDVLVVEDAHWADHATLELLLMLSASRSRDIRIVVTYRRTEVSAGSMLLRLTSRSLAPVTQVRVTLGPLPLDETAALVSSLFDNRQVSATFIAFLHDRTDGVPLAVEESLSLLHDRGEIVWRGGEWTRHAADDLQVPPTVRDSVLERVERLTRDTRRVLEVAAVLAAPAAEPVLGQVAGLTAEAVRRGLAQALDSGLLKEAGPGRFVFRHVLASRAVEEALPVSERRRMHHRAAAVLQDVVPLPVARLSRHFREANDMAGWSRHAEVAADLALESGDDRAAVTVLLELLTAAEHPADRRVRVARKLGEAAAWGVAALGDLGGDVTSALREVLEREDAPPAERGEIRLLLGRLLLQLGEFDAAAGQIESAVGDLGGRPELAARAMISLAWPRGRAWPATRHREWLARATRLFPRIPDGPERTWLEVDRASVLLMLGEESGWQRAVEIVAGAPTLFEQRQVARCLMNVGHVGIAWGRDGEARRCLHEATQLMQSTGYRRLLNSARLTLANLNWHNGNWEHLADRVGELIDAEDTLPEARLEARQVRALLHLAAGDRAVAARELRAVLAEATRRGVADAQLAPAAALGRLCLAGGEGEAAREVMLPAIEIVACKNMWLWASDIAPVCVDALVALGSLDAAERLVAEFAAGVSGRNAPAPEAALRVCWGIVADARGDACLARARFKDAAHAWSTLSRPYAELLAMQRWGGVMLRAGHREGALRLLSEVQERLRVLGARWDADRLARLLRGYGVQVARVWRGGRRGYGDQLSPRELEVARLVAQGLTNRQVAEALFLSPRTVGRHLGAAMRKLRVPSRTALAVAVIDAGLMPEGPVDAPS